MTRRYLLSISATNRIGALPAITGAIHELGGDMQEVSQSVMQNYLSMFLVADFPPQRDAQVIVDHISGVAKPFEAEVAIRETKYQEPYSNVDATERFFLTLHGYDSPGLIRQVTSKLAAESIEITDLYAVREGVGEPVVMIFELAVPEDADLCPLRGELEALGDDPSGLTAELQHESLFSETGIPSPVRIARAFQKEAWEESET